MFYSDSAQYNIIVKKVLIEKILNDLGKGSSVKYDFCFSTYVLSQIMTNSGR